MVLTRRGGYEYGDNATDTRKYMTDYSEGVGYAPEHFIDVACGCGSRTFALAVDDNEGAAVRTCSGCRKTHAIGDSADYLDGAQLEECACPCGAEAFEVTVGVALYRASEDVRWLYLGARCSACGLIGCYGDWKNEFPGYRELLARA